MSRKKKKKQKKMNSDHQQQSQHPSLSSFTEINERDTNSAFAVPPTNDDDDTANVIVTNNNNNNTGPPVSTIQHLRRNPTHRHRQSTNPYHAQAAAAAAATSAAAAAAAMTNNNNNNVQGRHRVVLTFPNHRRRVFRVPSSRVAIRTRPPRVLQHNVDGPPTVVPTTTIVSPTNNNNNNRNSRIRLPVEALRPNPLPENFQIQHRTTGKPRLIRLVHNNDDDDNLDLNDDHNHDETFHEVEEEEEEKTLQGTMDCVICYETLIQPAGCGQCTARFCLPCLMIALEQHRQCPVCRMEIQSEIILDAVLQNHLEKYGMVCPYCIPETFDGRLHPLGVHRIPHVNCPDLFVECRLAPYGCPWRGPRRQVLDHQNNSCAYEPITGFLEQFRQCQNRNEQNIQLLAISRPLPPPPPSPTSRSVFPDMLQFVTLLCTDPGQLERDTSSWRSFVDVRQNLEAALTCLPTVILQIKLLTSGFLEVIDNGINFEHSDLVALHSLTCFAIVVTVIGIFPCQGNGWRPLQFQIFGQEVVSTDRRLGVLLAIAAFIPQWWTFQQAKTMIRLWLLAILTTIGTCFFSSALTIAANTTLVPRQRAHIVVSSRATLPIRSALVLALVSQGADVLSLCDGIMVCVVLLFPLLRRCGINIIDTYNHNDPMLSYFAKLGTLTDRMFIALVRPLISLSWTKQSFFTEILVAWTMAIKWLLVHFGVLALVWLGKKTPLAIFGPNGRNPMALIFFCGWILSLYLLTIL